MQITFISEFLHHAGHAGLSNPQGLGNIGYMSSAFTLDEFVNALEIILGTLAWVSGHMESLCCADRCGNVHFA